MFTVLCDELCFEERESEKRETLQNLRTKPVTVTRGKVVGSAIYRCYKSSRGLKWNKFEEK